LLLRTFIVFIFVLYISPVQSLFISRLIYETWRFVCCRNSTMELGPARQLDPLRFGLLALLDA